MSDGGGPGFRFPWWLTASAFLLGVVMLAMHGRVELIDRPLFHVWTVPVTTFGLIFTVATTVVLVTVRNFLDSLHSTLRMSKVLVVVELLLVIGGVLFLVDVLLKTLGGPYDVSSGGAAMLADAIRFWGDSNTNSTP